MKTTAWLNPLPLLGLAWVWTVQLYNLCAWINNLAVIVMWHRYLIVTATKAAMR